MSDLVKKGNKEELVTDIICGMMKPVGDMKAKLKYQGKTYYFCTEGDKNMFEAYPEHWISKEKGGEDKKE